jgi:putative restriction endonuclease
MVNLALTFVNMLTFKSTSEHGNNTTRHHPMNTRDQFIQYMAETNTSGSGKATSYVRALDLLGPILAKPGSVFKDCSSVWGITSIARICELYEYVLEQQNLGESGIFGGEKPVSYWRDRYCSAALKSYREFLITTHHEAKLWDVFKQPGLSADDLAKKLSKQKLDYTGAIGKESIREVKTRVNQYFFRKMILQIYDGRCCITGLDIPQVLRASHIVSWAEDKDNRLNPTNGLCLSATFDAAFDAHLITLDEQYHLIFSPQLKEHQTNKAFQKHFKPYEDQPIMIPSAFSPSQTFLTHHREKLVS